MPLIWAILSFVAGVLLLAWSIHRRLGRTPGARAWADEPGSTATNTVLVMPGAGIALLGVGTMHWITSAVGGLGMLVLLPLGGILVLWGGFFDVPLWAVPRWARARVAHRRAQTTGTSKK